MYWTGIRTLAGLAAVSVVVSGCEPAAGGKPLFENLFSGNDDGATSTDTPAATSGGTVEKQEVEAPEIFEITDQGLWDGRPSLGGTWIAHPDVQDPQRVIIRDLDSGNSINGALFRRERENPGPAFQLSSDAATELGMLAGAPSNLKVTALKTVEVAQPALPLPTGADAVDAGTALPAEPEVALDPQPEPQPEPEASAAVPAAAIATTALQTTQIDPTPADPIAAAEAALARSDAIVAGETVAAPVQRPSDEPAIVSNLAKPFVQVGIFSQKVNADATAERLSSAGLFPDVKEQTARGQLIWRVLVGPAQTRSDRRGLLSQIRDLGFEDAYSVAD